MHCNYIVMHNIIHSFRTMQREHIEPYRQGHWWHPEGICPQWTCSLISPHTQSTHPACETVHKPYRSVSVPETKDSGSCVNYHTFWDDIIQKNNNCLRRELTLMWSKTAVATLVWRSISRFFSRSSGSELFGEPNSISWEPTYLRSD